MSTTNPTSTQQETLEPPERIRVVVRTATSDDWIGVAYCKDYTGDPSTIHEYARTSTNTSDSARRAAEEIASWYEDDTLQRPSVEEVAAIVSKHFAAAPNDNDAESLLELGDQKGRERAIKALRQSRATTTTTKGDR